MFYNISELTTSMANVVGFNDFHDTNIIPALPVSLTTSDSGMKFQDFHTFLDLDYIQSVLKEGQSLESYLLSSREKAIKLSLNRLVQHKQLKNVLKQDSFNTDILPKGSGHISKTIVNKSRLVGLFFNMPSDLAVHGSMPRIAISATELQVDLPIYLYHSSERDPIAQTTITTTKIGGYDWQTLGFDMRNYTDKYSDGSFFIGYYESDLVGNAIKYDMDWNRGFCGSCPNQRIWFDKYKELKKYLAINSAYFNPNDIDEVNKYSPDFESMIEDNNTNYGLNFNLNIGCDFTQLFKDLRLQFAQLIGYKMAEVVLYDMLNTPNTSYVTQSVKDNIYSDLKGDKSTLDISIPMKFEKALKALDFDTSKLSPICLKEYKNKKTRVRAI